jgi:hypothetical protein
MESMIAGALIGLAAVAARRGGGAPRTRSAQSHAHVWCSCSFSAVAAWCRRGATARLPPCRYQEAEKTNGRWAMAAVAGILFTDAMGLPKWYEAGALEYNIPATAQLGVLFPVMGFLELKRLQGFKQTGTVSCGCCLLPAAGRARLLACRCRGERAGAAPAGGGQRGGSRAVRAADGQAAGTCGAAARGGSAAAGPAQAASPGGCWQERRRGVTSTAACDPGNNVPASGTVPGQQQSAARSGAAAAPLLPPSGNFRPPDHALPPLPQSGFINSFPFDPAGMNSPAMQVKEVKNGRLAMVRSRSSSRMRCDAMRSTGTARLCLVMERHGVAGANAAAPARAAAP